GAFASQISKIRTKRPRPILSRELLREGGQISAAFGPGTAWGLRAELRRIGQTFFASAPGGYHDLYRSGERQPRRAFARKISKLNKKAQCTKNAANFSTAETECARSYACEDGLQQGTPIGPKE